MKSDIETANVVAVVESFIFLAKHSLSNFGPFELRSFSLAKTYLHSAASKPSSLRNAKPNQHHGYINVHRVYYLDVLNSAAAWSLCGRLAQCRRLQGHVPGAEVELVETHGQPLDQEQLLLEEEEGSLSRGRLQMRRPITHPPIISNHLPIRISTTTNHGGTRLPWPRPSRVTQAKCRVLRARVGATQLWKIAGPTSSA